MCFFCFAQVVDLLRQRSRPYLFSNAVAPAIIGAFCSCGLSARLYKEVQPPPLLVRFVRTCHSSWSSFPSDTLACRMLAYFYWMVLATPFQMRFVRTCRCSWSSFPLDALAYHMCQRVYIRWWRQRRNFRNGQLNFFVKTCACEVFTT